MKKCCQKNPVTNFPLISDMKNFTPCEMHESKFNPHDDKIHCKNHLILLWVNFFSFTKKRDRMNLKFNLKVFLTMKRRWRKTLPLLRFVQTSISSQTRENSLCKKFPKEFNLNSITENSIAMSFT